MLTAIFYARAALIGGGGLPNVREALSGALFKAMPHAPDGAGDDNGAANLYENFPPVEIIDWPAGKIRIRQNAMNERPRCGDVG